MPGYGTSSVELPGLPTTVFYRPELIYELKYPFFANDKKQIC
jgi:hypothetical protein